MPEARELDAEERDALEAGLDLAARISGCQRPMSLDQVQTLYDTYFAERVDNEAAVIALGVAFGQCLVSTGAFEWVRVVDEHHEETSLAVVGAAIYAHPISMMHKRLERRERVVLEQLCSETLAHLSEVVAEGNFRTR